MLDGRSSNARSSYLLIHRELVVLTVLIGLTTAAFFATRAVARSNEAARRRQALAWFKEAARGVRAGNAESAIDGFRRAVAKDPANRTYRLALAGALAASSLNAEAERVLLALRAEQPDDPEANLQLARLEARGAAADSAGRYYQAALAELWRPEQADERRRVRLELIEFLLDHGERARALSELLLIATNLPADAATQRHVGRMFLAAGDPRLALDHFARAIRLNSDDRAALVGAGEAAFTLGDYGRALRYLSAAPPQDARLAELREVARLVLTLDPLARRLTTSERRSRLLQGIHQARQRLESCLQQRSAEETAPLHELQVQTRGLWTALAGREGRDAAALLDAGLELVSRIERTVDQTCRIPPARLDRALLLIARKHGFEER